MTMAQQGWQPLAGVKVIDFSVFLPGPLTSLLLADLGAEVLKVEAPGGDPARAAMPALFQAANRNKRSIQLDLKSPDSSAVVKGLSQWADVAIEGFRPGVAKRLGIDGEQLQAYNPRLVVCAISGYGQQGPWNLKPGHDINYLAAAGALAYPGSWGQLPARSSVPIADVAGSGLSSTAILAALWERERTNKGRYLDLSLFESTLFCTAIRHGLQPETDSHAHLYPGNDLYITADQQLLTLGLLEDHFWQAFCNAVAHLDAGLGHKKYATIAARRQRGDELTERLRHLLLRLTCQEWVQLLEGTDVPFEVCASPAQAVDSSHVQARGRVVQHDNTRYVPFPVTVDGKYYPVSQAAAPALGEANSEFLPPKAGQG